ncbi:hypothetical protein DFJ73DRAFT_870777 [Zopfochytrium polystomum]|nr:hypothetical protein DFJ73DRAFT_870777 [Zopfochytrium polystomum]
MDDASAEGHVAALRWLRERGIVLDSSARALDRASMNGHTETVAWCALRHAVERRKMAALNWWFHSGLPLKYSSHTVKAALNAGLLSVLYQWRERERTEERRSQGDEQVVQQQHDPSSADAGAGAASDNVETAIVILVRVAPRQPRQPTRQPTCQPTGYPHLLSPLRRSTRLSTRQPLQQPTSEKQESENMSFLRRFCER